MAACLLEALSSKALLDAFHQVKIKVRVRLKVRELLKDDIKPFHVKANVCVHTYLLQKVATNKIASKMQLLAS